MSRDAYLGLLDDLGTLIEKAIELVAKVRVLGIEAGSRHFDPDLMSLTDAETRLNDAADHVFTAQSQAGR